MKIGELVKVVCCMFEMICFYEKEGLMLDVECIDLNYCNYIDVYVEWLCFICNCCVFDMVYDEICVLL